VLAVVAQVNTQTLLHPALVVLGAVVTVQLAAAAVLVLLIQVVVVAAAQTLELAVMAARAL
jgi:hypothetical protein